MNWLIYGQQAWLDKAAQDPRAAETHADAHSTIMSESETLPKARHFLQAPLQMAARKFEAG